MSIQFRCQGCSQSLKVPDGSSGKKVRCPQCETVNVIPESEDAAAGSPPPPPLPPNPPTASENPFAAPQSDVAPPPQQQFAVGDLSHQTINMGDVIDQSWKRFKPTLAMSALFGLVWAGIAVGSGIVGQVIQGGATVLGEPIIIGVAVVVSFVVQQVIQAFQQTLGKRYGLNVVRGSSEIMRGIFTFDKVVNVILLFLLIGVIVFAAAAVVALPVVVMTAIDGGQGGTASLIGVIFSGILGIIGVVAGLFFMVRIFLAIFFIIDRDAGVTDAMRQSSIYMTGNGLTAFFTMFLVGIGAMILGIFTCGIGFLISLPFMEVVQAMIYSKATGQYQDA